MEYKDYYKILGVAKSADDKAIKTAYRRLARKHHPDVSKGKDSASRFQEVSEAYEVLGDPEKRKRYDTLGPDWQRYAQQPQPGGPGGGYRVENFEDAGDFSDFFQSVFGNMGGFLVVKLVKPTKLFCSRPTHQCALDQLLLS